MVVLPGVLGYRPLRRTVQVRLGTNTLRFPGGTPICVISRQQFMKHPGWVLFDEVGGREKTKNEKPLDSLTRHDRGARKKPPLTTPRRTLENIPNPSQTAYGGLGLSSPSYLGGSI
ncbi:MAG: hypothetical protein WBF55_01415 [Syntrophobacteria bacterium]